MAAVGDFQEWNVEEPYLNLHSKLGEGPYFEKATNSLRWVDIINQRVHSVSLTEGPGSVKTIQLDTPVTVTADVEGLDPQEKILIGVKYGIALLDRKTGKYEYLSKFASVDGQANERLRSNDGGVDPHGRFWLGSMTDFGLGDIQPEGASSASHPDGFLRCCRPPCPGRTGRTGRSCRHAVRRYKPGRVVQVR